MLGCGKTSCVQCLSKLLVPLAGNSAYSGQKLLRFVWKASSWSRWAWCSSSIKTVGLYISLPCSPPALHLLWCPLEPLSQFQSQNQERACEEWHGKSNLREQSLVISGWQGTRVGVWEEQVLSSAHSLSPCGATLTLGISFWCICLSRRVGCRFFKSLGLLVSLVIYLCRQHLAFDLDNSMQCRLTSVIR